MNFFQESDVVAQVGEECVFGEFRVLNFFAGAECPKSVECFRACTGRIDSEASVADESSCFWIKVCGGFVECFAAAAASFKVEVIAPHVAGVQKPTCENV